MKRNDKQQIPGRCLAAALALSLSVCLAAPVMAENTPGAAAGEESSWSKASKEISEAARAVGEVSKETWGKTKETSAEVWDKTKETSSKAWDSTKKTTAKAWDKTKEAGSGVPEGSEDVADATVDTSKSFWQKTKETSARWYNAAKMKVHQITAPSTEK